MTKLVRAAGVMIAAVRMRRPLQDPRQTAVWRRQGPLLQPGAESRSGATLSQEHPAVNIAIAAVMAFAAGGVLWYQTRPATPIAAERAPQLQQLAQLRSQRTTLASQIQQIGAESTERETLARAECNGTAGLGLTGLRGDGPNCQLRREEADAFRHDSHLIENQALLAGIDSQIGQLEIKLATTSG